MPGGEPDGRPPAAGADRSAASAAPDDAPAGPPDAPDRLDAEVLRASVLGAGMAPTPARARLTPATLVALVLLLLSAGASVTFVLARGGLALPTAQPSGGAVAEVGASAGPSARPSTGPSVGTGPTAGPSVAPSPGPSTGTAAATAPDTGPAATSDRVAVIVACPGTATCWIYTIRKGDNLVSIANWFGVPLAIIYQMNPGLKTTPIRAGMQIRIPTPTR